MEVANQDKLNDQDNIQALIDVEHNEFNMGMDVNTRQQALVSMIGRLIIVLKSLFFFYKLLNF